MLKKFEECNYCALSPEEKEIIFPFITSLLPIENPSMRYFNQYKIKDNCWKMAFYSSLIRTIVYFTEDDLIEIIRQYKEIIKQPMETEEQQLVKPTVDFTEALDLVLDDIKQLLLKKNESYGNAAFNPVRIFSKADAAEQLKVRIDDKLSRIMRGNEFASEDTYKDLLGYLIIHEIQRNYAIK